MNRLARVCQLVLAREMALAIVLIGVTSFLHAPLFGGEWYFPREKTITSGRRGLSPAELAPIPLDDDPESRRTIAKMSRLVSLNVENLAFREFAELVARESGLQILVDSKALDEASVVEDQPITIQVDQVPLRQALRLALDPLELKCEVLGKVVLFTTAEKAKTQHITVVYPVFDLTVYPRKIENQRTTGEGADFDTLITLLQETIAPDSWEEAGGPGRISPFPASGALVLSQTREVQEQVEQALTALRKAKAIQKVETVSIPLDNVAPKESLTLASRSLGTTRISGAKRIRRPSRVNGWQMPRVGE
jgi:hypothetical protein